MERDMEFGTWNDSLLCRVGAIKSLKYRLDSVIVKEVRWEREEHQRTENYTLFYGNDQINHQLETGFFSLNTFISAFKR
jgi:hypothetical protein